jgi:hypothetical protein
MISRLLNLTAFASVVGGLLLVGCGASTTSTITGPASLTTIGTATPAPSPTTTALADPLRSAVEAYTRAYLGGDGATAFAMLSARCKLAIGSQQMNAAASDANSLYGVMPLTSFSVDSRTATHATVSYGLAVSKLDQTNQPWVLENGSWKYDHC